MRFFLLLVLFFCPLLSANAETVRFAVGPDHQKMIDNNYVVYRANWEFLAQSLALLGISLEAKPMPWARATSSVQSGQNHGLFLAANFEERNKWAILSKPLANEVFGCYFNRKNPDAKNVIAAVRLGGKDKILSYLEPSQLFNVATAQSGLNLLHNKRVDRFIMSKGYGQYLLDNELKEIKDNLVFDSKGSELRSLHVAFAKDNQESLAALKKVNQAIKLGMEKGLYKRAMKKYKVPEDMMASAY